MINEPMKEVIKRLRSGTIVQEQEVLGRPDGSRCCLGVMCDVAVERGIIPSPVVRPDHNGADCLEYDSAFTYPSVTVYRYFGLSCKSGSFKQEAYTQDGLVDMNDQGKTFAEIADIIESEPKGLFVEVTA